MGYIVNMSIFDDYPNRQKRKKLIEKGHALEDERDAKLEELDKKYADKIITDDEFEAELTRILDCYGDQYMSLYHQAWMLKHHTVKNDWFVNTFCKSFADGKHKVSQKQTLIFEKYCRPDNDTWRNSKYYCIAGNRHITYSAKTHYINIEPLISL